MSLTRYEIVRRYGGWSIACGDACGPPYLDRETAVRDATWVAELLIEHGEDVELYVDGEAVEIDPERAALQALIPTQWRH